MPYATRPDANLTEDAARKQARREREFYLHAARFAVVMSVLLAINLLTSPSSLWVVWPLLGWGVGLASHGFGVFGTRFGQGWVERRTRALMGEEASEARLRQLLDETLDEHRLPAGAPQDLARLQRRIEHLEAIATETAPPFPPLDAAPPEHARLDLDGLDAAPPSSNGTAGRGGAGRGGAGRPRAPS